MEKQIIDQMNGELLEKQIKTEMLGTTIFDADLVMKSEVAKGLRETTLIEDLA